MYFEPFQSPDLSLLIREQEGKPIELRESKQIEIREGQAMGINMGQIAENRSTIPAHSSMLA
jgi:hypothetical protein